MSSRWVVSSIAIAFGAMLAVSTAHAQAPPVRDASSLADPADPAVLAHWPTRRPPRLFRVVRTPRRLDGGLIAAASVVSDIGFVIGWMAGISGVGPHCGGVSCNSWWLSLIPVGGALGSTLIALPADRGRARDDGSLVGGFGIPSFIFQVVGLVMMIVAVSSRGHDLGRREITVSLGASPSEGGVTLAGRF